jgi:AcrR family transcriptional regulator
MPLDQRQLEAVEKAFHDHGYDRITMTAIAGACGFSRRALYHHYSSKEEAFRDVVIFGNVRGMKNGAEAAELAFGRGDNAIEVIHALLNTRFGDMRRTVSHSPHVQALTDAVSRLCGDIVDDFAGRLHTESAALLQRLQANGKLKIRPDVSFSDLARMLAEGARGVNQTRPAPKESEFSPRYRSIIKVILRGSADLTPE